MGGKVHVYRRDTSALWQCSTYSQGRNHRQSTKENSLALAKEFAEDWYLELRGKSKRGELFRDKIFADAAKQFTIEYVVITLEYQMVGVNRRTFTNQFEVGSQFAEGRDHAASLVETRA